MPFLRCISSLQLGSAFEVHKLHACRRTNFRCRLRISYTNRITNEDVCKRVNHQVNDYKDILTTIKKRKLNLYGLVTRSWGHFKTIIQGTVQGEGKAKERRFLRCRPALIWKIPTCGTLQEFKVLLNFMSISSRNNFGSDLKR